MCFVMKIIRQTELLSPAGKWEALLGAVQNGADAVYIGEKSFSARKNAANFTWEEIKEAVKYCHIRGVKVHLALNTLLSDSELPSFEKSVVKAADCGVDALIIQDIGAGEIARSICPEMELHASTQLTACNIYDVEALQKRGFSRIVLSRELSEKEIRHIYENTDATLEAFVHGALCISFSGKCLMSSFIGGRSGNRGMCAQPCRQKYSSCNKNGYLLSPRDLCLADEIEKMQRSGITSFKIEGRMKSPEYVATVTNIYRKYLDSLLPLSKEDEEKLEKIFVRGDGFTKAYFCEQNTPEIMNYSISNDKLSSRADESILKEARNSYKEGAENRKVSVDARLVLKTGNEAVLTLDDGGNRVKAYGAKVQVAQNVALSPERAYAQIAKMGQTPFVLESFELDGEDNTTIAVSELNSLRRKACDMLCDKRSSINKKEVYNFEYPGEKKKKYTQSNICVQVCTKEQFEAAGFAQRVLVPLSLWDKIIPDERCFVLLPQVVLDEKKVLQQLSKIPVSYGVYASSVGMLSLAKTGGRKAYADWAANIYNSVSANEFGKICDAITLSPELSLEGIRKISQRTAAECEALCYGYQTVMTSRACLIRGITGKCDCSSTIDIKDKTGASFKIIGDKESHLNTVLNSRPTFMADKLNEIRKSGIKWIRLVFTTESAKETEKIIKMYLGKIPVEKPVEFTRGYFMK